MKLHLLGASLALLALAACSPDTPTTGTAPASAAETAAIPITIAAPAGDYAADPTHASITFKVHHFGLGYYSMKFRTFDATVAFDPANIAASKVSATIRPSDIIVGYPA